MNPIDTDPQARHVFERWHQAVMTQDAPGVAALYTPDAVFESPAVWVLNRQSDGILRGRAAIEAYFATFLSKLGNEGREWFRDGRYFFDGKLLMWEYPRQTPQGDQNDIVESIDLEGGLIARHRVYWGWVGVKGFVARLEAAAASR